MCTTSTDAQQSELERLRRQLENLQRLESGLNVPPPPPPQATSGRPQDGNRVPRQASTGRDISQEEMDRLRRHVSDLQQAEDGRASSLPPPPPIRDFTVSEQASGPRKNGGNKKYLTYAVGVVSVVGIILAIAAMRNFGNATTPNQNQVPAAPPQNGLPPQSGGGNNMTPSPPTGGGGGGGGDNNKITFDELAKHNTPDDCWMALHDTVYDLTEYAPTHPAGASIITFLCGTDGTSEYARFHSEPLLNSVKGDVVGELDKSGGTPPPPSGGNPPSANGCSPEEDDTCVSIAELARHNTAADCWVAMHGNVYDMTDYANRHPGGARVVTELAGTDGTNEYRRFHGENLLRSVGSTLIGPYEGGIEADDGQGGMGSPDSPDSPDD